MNTTDQNMTLTRLDLILLTYSHRAFNQSNVLSIKITSLSAFAEKERVKICGWQCISV